MKKIIIVRHGSYYGRSLDDTGRLQMSAMGNAIKSLFNENLTIRIISSTAARAEQSAKIIADILGISYEMFDFLWSGPEAPRGCSTDLAKTLELIKRSINDVLILVTHLEYSEDLPTFLAKQLLEGVRGFPSKETGKGEAWIVDCEAKTCTLLAPKYLV